jgi:hypothetical protein
MKMMTIIEVTKIIRNLPEKKQDFLVKFVL